VSMCLRVTVCVHAVKEKRLDLSTSNDTKTNISEYTEPIASPNFQKELADIWIWIINLTYFF